MRKNVATAVVLLLYVVVISAVTGWGFNAVVVGTTVIGAVLGLAIVVRHVLTPPERTLMRFAARLEIASSLEDAYNRVLRQFSRWDVKIVTDQFDENGDAFLVQGEREPRRSYHSQLVTIYGSTAAGHLQADRPDSAPHVCLICQSRSRVAGALFDFGENRAAVRELAEFVCEGTAELEWLSRRKQFQVFRSIEDRGLD